MRAEHAFTAIEQMGGKLIRTIGQARANFVMTMMAVCELALADTSPYQVYYLLGRARTE